MNLLEASLVGMKRPPRWSNDWALEPFASGDGEVPCLVGSRYLSGFVEGVANRALL